MSEQSELLPEIVSAVRVRCGGVEFAEDGRVKLAIHDLHQKVDAVIATFANGATRVSCPYFDRDKEGVSVCRAQEHSGYFRARVDDDKLPYCTYSYDQPGELENHLTRHEIPENEEEVEEEIEAEIEQDEEDDMFSEDYVPEE